MSTPKAERSVATRAALVAAARDLFAEQGYADTSTTGIVERAGVTRGALYHHFRDKEALFRAVYEDVERGVTERVFASLQAAGDDPIAMLRTATESFLDECLDPAMQRIVLLEGPTVLGWSVWRELDEAYGLGMVRTGLQLAMTEGAIRDLPLDALAHIMLGAMIEAGLVVAHAEDPKRARDEMAEVAGAILEGLAAPRRDRPPSGAPRRVR